MFSRTNRGSKSSVVSVYSYQNNSYMDNLFSLFYKKIYKWNKIRDKEIWVKLFITVDIFLSYKNKTNNNNKIIKCSGGTGGSENLLSMGFQINKK